MSRSQPTNNDESRIEKNLVVVRIWTSGFHNTHQGDDVGHISLHMPNANAGDASADTHESSTLNYISLWPKRVAEPNDSSNSSDVGFFKPVPGTLLSNPDEDIKLEEREPELIYYLHFFDVEKIIETFKQTTDQLNGWALFGANVLYPTESHSCATLAAAMLKAGDINDFFTPGSVTSITSPDQLSEAIRKTKLNEIEEFKRRNINIPSYPDETDAREKVRKIDCCVM